jgi:hypothetical protein
VHPRQNSCRHLCTFDATITNPRFSSSSLLEFNQWLAQPLFLRKLKLLQLRNTFISKE